MSPQPTQSSAVRDAHRVVAAVKNFVEAAFTRANPSYGQLLDRVDMLERRLEALEKR
jgi:hypothetical protein